MIGSVDLGKDLEGFVTELVTTDRFTSVNAVLRESVRLLEERERKRADIAAAIDIGLAAASDGRMKPLDDVFDRLEARIGAARGPA